MKSRVAEVVAPPPTKRLSWLESHLTSIANSFDIIRREVQGLQTTQERDRLLLQESETVVNRIQGTLFVTGGANTRAELLRRISVTADLIGKFRGRTFGIHELIFREIVIDIEKPALKYWKKCSDWVIP